MSKSLDDIFKDYAPILTEIKDVDQKDSVTVWISKDYKQRYDVLQAKTKRKFSKLLVEVIKSAIDKAESSI